MSDSMIPFGRPWITDTEKQAVLNVLGGDVLTHGPRCKAFEEKFLSFMGGDGHCITVSSGMAALHLSYFLMGLKPGDEVLVPALTHVATVHAVEVMGAKPVFVDCDPKTGNVTVEQLEAALTPATKAISVVHFLGIPCAMEEIMALADRRGIKVVEDCALAVGSRVNGKHVGFFGESGCFSFYPVKHITTGEGGMFVTRHASVANGLKKARAFGLDRSFEERKVPGMYDVVALGLNYRMSDINAAVGEVQISRIQEILDRRAANFQQLKKSLADINEITILDTHDPRAVNSHYCLSLVLPDKAKEKRADVLLKLKADGVGTSVYYPQPVARMTYYQKKYGYDSNKFKQAERISDQSVALPVGPHLTADHIDTVATKVKKVLKEILS